MKIRRNIFSHTLCIVQAILICIILFSSLQFIDCIEGEAILYTASPAAIKQYYFPYPANRDIGYFHVGSFFKPKETRQLKQLPVSSEKVFHIEASDAIDGIKYSQPAISYPHALYPGMKVPSSPFVKQSVPQMPTQKFKPFDFKSHTASSGDNFSKNILNSSRGVRFLDSPTNEDVHTAKTDLKTEQVVKNGSVEVFQSESNYNTISPNEFSLDKNLTEASDNLISLSSDAVLSYEIPSSDFNGSISTNLYKEKEKTGHIAEGPSLNYDFNLSSVTPALPELSTETSVLFSTHFYIDFTNQTNATDLNMSTNIFPYSNYSGNVSQELHNKDNKKLSSGTVAGIVIGVLVCVTLLSSAVIYLLYRKFNGKCTSVVESKFNSDNCGYLDDSLRSSIYLNNHIELPKESSEEMTSLDNDSFLNSLETMTIQNYWADNSKKY